MNSDKTINFLFEIASLRRLTRSHRQVVETASDNISDHSFRTAMIGMILAGEEGCDENKVMKMCLFHDLAEARTGDANFVNKHYTKMNEEEAMEDQLEGLDIKKEIMDILQEYNERKTREAIVSKDADNLDQMLLQQEYFYNDKNNGRIWQEHTSHYLKTETAKELAKKISDANPLEWIYHLAEKKDGENIKR